MKPYLTIALIAAAFWSAGTTLAGDRPNVIVIVADDLGYADVGFHAVIADGVKTPNLNRLAASGVTFTNAYSASPVCSNSRLALITGRYPQRWGGYYYGEGGLPSSEQTISEVMQEAGYRTMKVGKTHLNYGPKEDPMKHGFDHFLGFVNHSWDFNLLSEKDVEAYEKKQKGSSKKARMAPIGPLTRDNGIKESFEDTTTTEIFGRESVNFINEQSDKLFYLQLEFNAVHTPLTRPPNKSFAEKYGIPLRPFDRDAAVWEYPLWDPVVQPDFAEWYQDATHLRKTDPYGRKIYLAHLELMDMMIGNVMTALKERGIVDDTIILFTSDNGGSDQSYANNGELNAYKYCLMDGGIKVPMILSWPAKFRPMRTDAVVTHRDFFPSLSQILGISPQHSMDGKSLLPLLAGEVTEAHADEPMYWDAGKQDNWVVRQGDWKLVYRKNAKSYKAYQLDDDGLLLPNFKNVKIPAGMQLYNLSEDTGEKVDLSGQHPERVASMEKMYAEWRSQMADPISGKKAK